MRVLSPLDPSREPRCATARGLVAPPVRAGLESPAPSPGVHADVDLKAFEHWSTEAQERALQLIEQRNLSPWHPFYCPNPNCDGLPHDNWTWNHARVEQRPPPMTDEWLVWLLLGGRGGGKTRVGSEATNKMARKVPRLHLIAPTGPDLRETMVEGESGIQATAPPDFIPQWEPSKKKLTWPNGAIALGFSGEEPDRLRGPQCYWTWIDEPALMPLIYGDNGVWNNMLFGLRLGRQINFKPWVCATTTPKQNKWTKETVKDPETVVSRLSTYDNLDNLADTFRRTVVKRFEGTRLGRQELHGEVLPDVEGALWKGEWIRYIDIANRPEMDRIVVSIDPAGSTNHTSDETGIVVIGIKGEVLYILADYTDKYSPAGWASRAVAAYHEFSADALVVERNYGGDMVREVLEKNGARNINIRDVISRRGKAIRAEPIAALYEKGSGDNEPRVFHILKATPELEDELTTWVPGESDSPNRLDALVHGATDLAKRVMPSEVASPTDLLRGATYRVRGMARAGR